MAYNYEYPYVDPERYNSDWLINKVKELAEEWKKVTKDWETMQNSFQSLYDYVMDYFKNLDVQEEINVKIDSMLADGTLERIIAEIIGDRVSPEIVGSIDDMNDKTKVYVLSETGNFYQWDGEKWVDTGLSYSITNDALISVKTLITADNANLFPDADLYPKNKIYAIMDSAYPLIKNLPPNLFLGGMLVDMSYFPSISNGRIQVFYPRSANNSYVRINWGTSWTEWKAQSGSSVVLLSTNVSTYAPNATIADLYLNTNTFIDSAITEEQLRGLPIYGTRGILMLSSAVNGIAGEHANIQFFITGNSIYYKLNWGGFDTGVWNLVGNSGSIIGPDSELTDANSLPPNAYYIINSNVTAENFSNLPMYGYISYLHCFSYYNNLNGDGVPQKFQVLYTQEGIWHRSYITTWTGWRKDGISTSNYTLLSTSTAVWPEYYRDANLFLPQSYLVMSVNDNQIANLPVYGTRLVVLTLGNSTSSQSGKFQIAYDYFLGNIYTRCCWSSEWTPWNIINSTNALYTYTCLQKPYNLTSASKIVCYGDSIFTAIGGGEAVPDIIKSRIGCTVNNYSVGGARISTKNVTNTIINQVISTPGEILSEADLVLINAGTNDASKNEDYEDVKSGIDEVIGQIRTVNQEVKIVWITPIPKIYQTYNGLAFYSGVICYQVLGNNCGVINGSMAPIPMQPASEFPFIPRRTIDGVHPDAVGKSILADYILTQLL